VSKLVSIGKLLPVRSTKYSYRLVVNYTDQTQ